MDETKGNEWRPIQNTVWPSLQVGSLTGASGLVFGGVAGVIRSSSPPLFAIASGIQWFLLGATFWAARSTMLGSWQGSAKPGDKVLVSGLAGSLTGGTVAFLTRGRANVIPGTIMYSLLGLSGQGVYNYADARHTRWEMGGTGEGNESSFWRKLADMKWSPVKVLSDDEYRDLLEGKLQRVNAEIALTDENIKKLAEKSRPSAEKNI